MVLLIPLQSVWQALLSHELAAIDVGLLPQSVMKYRIRSCSPAAASQHLEVSPRVALLQACSLLLQASWWGLTSS